MPSPGSRKSFIRLFRSGLQVFAEKLSLFPSGCHVLVRHEKVIGYGLSHPWILNSIPPLDSFLKGILAMRTASTFTTWRSYLKSGAPICRALC